MRRGLEKCFRRSEHLYAASMLRTVENDAKRWDFVIHTASWQRADDKIVWRRVKSTVNMAALHWCRWWWIALRVTW